MQQTHSMPKPSDRWIPWYIVGFFILLVLVLVPMCILAVRTNTGLVTDNSYEKGLAYNQAIAAGKEQEILKWNGTLTAVRTAEGQTRIDLTLTDDKGKRIDGADVKLLFVRPTQSGMDQSTKMGALNGGHYQATLSLPVGGLWEATASATTEGKNYQILRRFVLP